MEIRALTAEEEQARQSARALASRLLDKSAPLEAADVQVLYTVLRDDRPQFDEGVIALGVVFGELIATKANYEWVRVIDEWGSENSLSPPGTNVSCHSISMMQKRIVQAEDVDIGQLCDDTIAAVQNLIDKGEYAARERLS